MKKKRLFVISLIIVLIFAAGCNSKKNKKEADSSVQQEETSEENTDNVSSTEALDVSNDTFSFDGAVSWIGTQETEVITALGAQETGEAYETQLFGEDVSVGLTSEEGVVKSIQVTFASTNMESVANAVSEQLGQDGENTDETVKWNFEEKEIVLSQSGDGCVLDIQ